MRTKEQLLKLCKMMPCTPVGLLSYGIMTQEEYDAYFKPKEEELENKLKKMAGF